MEHKICYSRGCYNAVADMPELGSCVSMGCNKLDTHDWLLDIPESTLTSDMVEVRFKNTRKGYFKNVNSIRLVKGDIVAVEASPGHDIGIVALAGDLVIQQMRKNKVVLDPNDVKKVYRKAKPADIEKWLEAITLEKKTMLKARQIASRLKLNMKIGDVEFQGDRTKAIFYYYAEDRVDFRELIKVLAEEFRVRIEMKQIGARQEAGRIGGIGTCGRELCCASWITNFVSVTTSAARYQELSLNPQKLAGQCGKLKCCLNYEVHSYVDARQDFPDITIVLEAGEGTLQHQKTDVFKRTMWYSLYKDSGSSLVALSVDQVKEIIEMNKKGQKPGKLNTVEVPAKVELDFQNVVGQESITRFEDPRAKNKKKKKKKRKFKPNSNEGNANA
jgi:cell fate regulator YaaT (PSP1 superfamily)